MVKQILHTCQCQSAWNVCKHTSHSSYQIKIIGVIPSIILIRVVCLHAKPKASIQSDIHWQVSSKHSSVCNIRKCSHQSSTLRAAKCDSRNRAAVKAIYRQRVCSAGVIQSTQCTFVLSSTTGISHCQTFLFTLPKHCWNAVCSFCGMQTVQ